MAFSHGMNTAEVLNQAGRLDNEANAIHDVIQKINGIVAVLEANWSGPDMAQFRGWWESEHRRALERAQLAISGLAESAKNNVRDQDTASSPY